MSSYQIDKYKKIHIRKGFELYNKISYRVYDFNTCFYLWNSEMILQILFELAVLLNFKQNNIYLLIYIIIKKNINGIKLTNSNIIYTLNFYFNAYDCDAEFYKLIPYFHQFHYHIFRNSYNNIDSIIDRITVDKLGYLK